MKNKQRTGLPVFQNIFLIFFSLVISCNGFAQTGGVKVRVEIVVVGLGYQNIKERGQTRPVWKFYHDEINRVNLLTNNSGDCFGSKELRSKKSHKDFYFDNENEGALEGFVSVFPRFTIMMQGYTSGRKGDICVYDSKDENIAVMPPQSFDLSNLAPNTLSEEQTVYDKFPRFHATLKYKYNIESLGNIESSVKTAMIGGNKSIMLTLPLSFPGKDDYMYNWQYATGNGVWKDLGNAGKGKLRVNVDPTNDFFEGNLTGKQTIKVHVTSPMGKLTVTSEPLELIFAPPPPSYDEANKQVLPSCAGAANGSISIKNWKASTEKIKFVLRDAALGTDACNLQNPSSCPGYIRDGNANGGNISITGLKAGKYILLVYNADAESGNVYTPVPFTIDEAAEVKIKNFTPTNLTCANEQGGEIALEVEGGNYIWQAAITPNRGRFERKGDDLFLFKDLKEGSYTIELTDQCGKSLSQVVPIKRSKRLKLDNIEMQNTPETGLALSIVDGSGEYQIKLTDYNFTEKTIEQTPDMLVPITEAGVYKLSIKDKKNPDCPAVERKITIEKVKNSKPPKFTIKSQE